MFDRQEMRELPKNIEAEQVVLGAAMLEPDIVMPVLIERLVADNFYDRRHRAIFSAMSDLFVQGRPCDTVILANRLEDIGQMERAGGRMYLNELLDRTTTTASLGHFADIVRQNGIRREVINRGLHLADAAYDVGKGLDSLQAMADDIGLVFADSTQEGIKPLSGYAQEAITHMARVIMSGQQGISSGFKNLDKIIGGFEPGLYILAGRPGMGKTSFGVDMAYRQADMLHPVHGRKVRPGIISIEMKGAPILERLVCRELHHHWKSVPRNMTPTEYCQKVTRAMGIVQQKAVLIDERSHYTIQTVDAAIFELVMRHKADIVYIDYLQLLGNKEGKDTNRDRELSSVMARLVRMRRRFNVPIVILCQLNRDIERRTDKKPSLADLRDSGSIEQDADVVMFSYDPIKFGIQGSHQIIVSKNRSGDTGIAYLEWDKPQFLFHDSIYMPADEEAKQRPSFSSFQK